MKATKVLKILGLFSVVCAVFFAESALADPSTSGIALTSLEKSLGASILQIARILSDIALITGISFILASFFKFHQHKLNPTQVPISQGVTLLLIGAALTVFVVLIPTSKTALFGKEVKSAKIGDDQMKNLIGGSGA